MTCSVFTDYDVGSWSEEWEFKNQCEEVQNFGGLAFFKYYNKIYEVREEKNRLCHLEIFAISIPKQKIISQVFHNTSILKSGKFRRKQNDLLSTLIETLIAIEEVLARRLLKKKKGN